jgi:hypothetical protein
LRNKYDYCKTQGELAVATWSKFGERGLRCLMNDKQALIDFCPERAEELSKKLSEHPNTKEPLIALAEELRRCQLPEAADIVAEYIDRAPSKPVSRRLRPR